MTHFSMTSRLSEPTDLNLHGEGRASVGRFQGLGNALIARGDLIPRYRRARPRCDAYRKRKTSRQAGAAHAPHSKFRFIAHCVDTPVFSRSIPAMQLHCSFVFVFCASQNIALSPPLRLCWAMLVIPRCFFFFSSNPANSSSFIVYRAS